MRLSILLLMGLFWGGFAYADIDSERLATAIYHAEGGLKASKPYGVLKSYCKKGDPDGQCRKGCIQTIEGFKERVKNNPIIHDDKSFITAFGRRYCPEGSDTDNGTCQFWAGNVYSIYKKGTK